MADGLAGALSPVQKRAIGQYLARAFGAIRYRVIEVDPANDPMVMVEIVWPFDHGLCGGVLFGVVIIEPLMRPTWANT